MKRKIDKLRLKKILKKAITPWKTEVVQVRQLPDIDTYWALNDGYLMQYQKSEHKRPIFLKELYQELRCEKVSEDALTEARRDLDVKLKIRANEISTRALRERSVNIDLESRGLEMTLEASFCAKGSIICVYEGIQPRGKHEYTKKLREFGWRLVSCNASAAQVAALYDRLKAENSLEFNLYL